MTFPDGQLLPERKVFQSRSESFWGLKSMFKISFSNIFIMDTNFAGLCENVNNFGKDGLSASDNYFIQIEANKWLTNVRTSITPKCYDIDNFNNHLCQFIENPWLRYLTCRNIIMCSYELIEGPILAHDDFLLTLCLKK